VAKELGDFKSELRGGSSNAREKHGVSCTIDDADVQELSAYLDAL
jgi:hypothetical protein